MNETRISPLCKTEIPQKCAQRNDLHVWKAHLLNVSLIRAESVIGTFLSFALARERPCFLALEIIEAPCPLELCRETGSVTVS